MAMPDRIWIDSKPWDDLLCGGWEYEECDDANTEYIRKDWLIENIKEMKTDSLNSAERAALENVLFDLLGEE